MRKQWQVIKPALNSRTSFKSRIAEINPETFDKAFEKNDVLVVAGFQGINDEFEITTLGRGGSDTTAVALAAANNTPCEIYTDVDGVYATDPRIYKDANDSVLFLMKKWWKWVR